MKICENGSCKVGTVLYFFGKEECPECKRLKETLDSKKIIYAYFDIQTVEGLSKAAYYNIFEVPVLLLVENGKELKRWKENFPIEEIEKHLQ
ncbi:MAG: hypothetical protein DRI36_01080 [Caldiserica bacterium]|nr:MAG: hypothetical protein DRI36_01080 [Caldisericota bacterium]